MSFTRTIENFTCEHCGTAVTGNGYTNHCPHCLWSKHVDIDPGDRAAECGEMMRPTRIEYISGEYSVTHTCETCGYVKKNKISGEDNMIVVADIMRSTAER